MSFLRRLRALFRRNQPDRDMAEEMRFHLDERTDDHVNDGLPSDEARAAAHRKFGGVAQIQEHVRLRVVGFGWRRLQHTPPNRLNHGSVPGPSEVPTPAPGRGPGAPHH